MRQPPQCSSLPARLGFNLQEVMMFETCRIIWAIIRMWIL